MPTITQESVVSWLRSHLKMPEEAKKKDNRGPDLTWQDGEVVYYVEAIAFSDRTTSGVTKRGKNQSDLWKAFSQAISRLNPDSKWGKTDRVAIALPREFLAGWNERVTIIGSSIWQRIGQAFPELEVWFVSQTGLLRLSWNDTSLFGHPQFLTSYRLLQSGEVERLKDFLTTEEIEPGVQRLLHALLELTP